MRVRLDGYGKPIEMSLEQAIERQLDQADYYAGAQERISSKVEETAKAFAKLVVMLHENERITTEQALEFCGYNAEEIK